MFIRNSAPLIFQFSHFLTKLTFPRTRTINFVECKLCGAFPYSTGNCNKSEYLSSNEADVDEYSFETEDETPHKLMEKLCSNDNSKVEKFKRLQLLIQVLRDKGDAMPDEVREKQWERLLCYEKKSDIVNYLRLLQRREKNRKLAKTANKIDKNRYLKAKNEEESIEVTTEGPVIYKLRFNTLFFRLYNHQLDKFYNYKLLQAMMFAPTIIVDCGYETDLEIRDIDKSASRILKMWSVNRDNVTPFHIQFCNLNLRGRMMERFREVMNNLDDPAYPFFFTPKSYLDMYPKEKLVYLTPDSKNDLKEFNSDDIYIFGGLSHLADNAPLSRMKARKEGLRTAKFPLKNYNVKLSRLQYSLDLHLAVNILNDLKEANDWSYAFRHVNNLPHTEYEHRSEVHTLDQAVKKDHRLKLTYDLLLAKSRDVK